MSNDNSMIKRDNYITRYEPQDFDGLARLASAVVQSGLTPNGVKSPQDAMVILMTGAELGLTAMQSLRAIHVVKGKPAMSADLMKALCLASGEVTKWEYEEKSKERCAVTVQRGDMQPESFEWTMGDARNAGLLSNGVWKSYPAQMLRHRCDSDAARAVFPDLLLGMYTPDELEAAPEIVEQTIEAKPASRESVENVQDAEFEEAPSEPEGPTDYSDDGEWVVQNSRYFALATRGDCDQELAEQLRSAIKTHHGVDSWKQLEPSKLEGWSDRLEKRSPEARMIDGDPVESERRAWMEDVISKVLGNEEAA